MRRGVPKERISSLASLARTRLRVWEERIRRLSETNWRS